MVVEEVKEIVVTHMAMAFLVTKICLSIIGPKKREGKLMRIAKSTRNFKSQDMIKKICHKLILVRASFTNRFYGIYWRWNFKTNTFFYQHALQTGLMRLEARG